MNAGRNEWWMLIRGHPRRRGNGESGFACSAPTPRGRRFRAADRAAVARARSANISGAHRPQWIPEFFEQFLLADTSQLYPSVLAAGDDRGPDHTRTKHRDLHTVALSLGAQRLGDRDDGVLAGGVAGL